MQSKMISVNHNFIGRERESLELTRIGNANEASIVVMYGRRRIGKTELLEQVYHQRNILKFEGVADKSEDEQREIVLQQLASYTGEKLITKITTKNWIEVFDVIYKYIQNGEWTLYFEELQWLACYKDNFISELKYYWDNYFRHNKKLIIILCGSSPSFMINHVMHSKALYNRSQHEFALNELNLIEAEKLLGKRSHREIMNAYLTLGGIPEYLNVINKSSSLHLGICKNSFLPNSYFKQEFERIFISSLANNPQYKKIIHFLAKKHFATRDEILSHLKLSSSGYLTKFLTDLELCGFIKRYVPYNLNDSSMLARYTIHDAYLQFYFQFIQPKMALIDDGAYLQNQITALKQENYYKWLGFAFERFCRRFSYVIARMLGFSAVNYRSGVFFNKAANNDQPGYQIDLIFDRDDHVMTVCEIKYLQSKVNTNIIEEFERKLDYLPGRDKKTIDKVLITTEGVTDSLKNRAYFDHVIILEDWFDARNWR